MRTVGVIVEYNPFHNGHLHHLQQARQITSSDAVVAVMSGHFLQRGEPALLDKWSRAEMALAGGCDLVLELPVAYATQAAEWFAYGAVATLAATGVVDALCFGTESGRIAPLQEAAALLLDEPPAFREALQSKLSLGSSYPSAFSSVLAEQITCSPEPNGQPFDYRLPNHTLGLHYLIALGRLKSTIEPFCIPRVKAQYADKHIADSSIASATALRQLLVDTSDPTVLASYMPQGALTILQRATDIGIAPVQWQHFMRQLVHQIATSPASDLAGYHEITEGLEHRIKQAIGRLKTLSFDVLIEELKTKRYTRTKLQRALLSLLLGHTKEQFSRAQLTNGISYIRVLGFSSKGRALLRRMQANASAPVLMSAARAPENCRLLSLDVQATGAYALALPDEQAASLILRDYKQKPLMSL